MNRNLTILALTGTLALGGVLGYQAKEGGLPSQGAATTSQANPVQASTAQDVTASGTLVQTRTSPPATATTAYDAGRARTESEANTVQVVKERQDGLVYISVTEADSSSAEARMRQRLQEQFGFSLPQDQGGGVPATGTGSGFFVSAQGDIVTNNHVVEGASEITIRLHGSKQTYKAKVIARAPDYDLALLRAEGVAPSSIKPLPLGDSDKLDVGLKAIAMGAPFNLDFSVSEGIISSLERQVPVGSREVVQPVIQTDAAINPGNSGGPLLSSAGEVIGVNTQILTGGAGQSAGVGFAIPINTVKRLLPQLQAGQGGVVSPPSLGVVFTDLGSLPPEQLRAAGLPTSGALIQKVYPGSPAAAAGLRGGSNGELTLPSAQGTSALSTDGDLITAVGGQPLTDASSLQQAVLATGEGQPLRLTVRRGGQSREVEVTLQAFQFPQNQQ
ncbi:S1C family serine protease [Deinococcus wulumuqiensis]|uniref:Serine protease n=1 Tax=Deinococcus wulumuqiensis TaxID=980427 RepID=A0AAV4K4Y6_9DEIO|nr:trypsin-like peptidase domain-containing protein [Deinococcus wulumuqiensis]QII19739.1 PDZ domain-containing protein [Deinococcus wulumuqiensis R12]GGI71356.1 serine protease [Deinococcus wulumuqiensis]GGP28432.1 serine protease [Deinococcus wulumuqiensis]